MDPSRNFVAELWSIQEQWRMYLCFFGIWLSYMQIVIHVELKFPESFFHPHVLYVA